MKRSMIAVLLLLAILGTVAVPGDFAQAKTTKYEVYNSKQAKVRGSKLIVKGPLYVGTKQIKKKKVFILTGKTKYWDPNYYGSDPMIGKKLTKEEFKDLLKAQLGLTIKVTNGKVTKCELSS